MNRSNDGFSAKECVRWFKEYTSVGDETPDVIGPDGIERLCQDLDVEPENVVMLGTIEQLEEFFGLFVVVKYEIVFQFWPTKWVLDVWAISHWQNGKPD